MADDYCYTFSAKEGYIRRCKKDSRGRCDYNDCEDVREDRLNKNVAREFKRLRNAIAHNEFLRDEKEA